MYETTGNECLVAFNANFFGVLNVGKSVSKLGLRFV